MEENQVNIPNGWTLTSFGDKDMFRIIGSGIKYFNNEKEYYSTSSIDGNRFLFAEQLITYRNRPSRANMQPIENSIWFAKMKNTFKVLKAQKKEIEEVILSTGFSGIESTVVDCDYLMQILSSEEFNSQKNLLAEGSTQEAVNNTKIKEIKFLLPKNPKEQTQIAIILSKIDETISQTERLITKYTRIKTGLMQDLLTKGIDENGNIRSEETHEFKDSPLGRIPKEWEVPKIDDIKEFITSGSRGWAKYYSVEGNQFIRITNLKRKQIEIDKTEMKFVQLPGSAEGMRSKLQVGDLLISITADLGIIGIVPDDFGDAFINQHIALVRLNQADIYPDFIGYFLCSQQGQRMFNLLNDGGAKAGLNLKTVGNIPVIKPSKAEQILIVERIEAVNKTVREFEIQHSKLQSLKTGLMQDLLSGKVRVNHLIKETANV